MEQGKNSEEKNSEDKNKKLVQQNIWRLGPKKYFYSYTADWCGPCTRIKPHVLENLSNYKNIESKNISLTEFKEINKYIPFFIIKNDSEQKTLQSSDKQLFLEFISQINSENIRNNYENSRNNYENSRNNYENSTNNFEIDDDF